MYADPMDYEITANALARLREEVTTVILLDVREPWEFQTARIEGSLLMSMGEVPGRAHQELDPDAHIVTICHHGMRSLNVAVWLRNRGFPQTQSLQGGIDAWSGAVDPSIAHY